MFKLSLSIKHNIIEVTRQLVKELKVKVTSSTIQENLEAHPDFPSLLAISDSLNEWGVDNQSYKIDKQEFSADDLLFPFIAHLPEEGGRFTLVKTIANDRVEGIDEKGKLDISTEEFLRRWSGIALYATPTEHSGESAYRSNAFKSFLRSLIAPTALILLCCILYFLLGKSVITSGLMLSILLKLTGIALSILLLMQSLNSNNPFIKNLCGLTGKNDCNAILKSQASQVTSWLSWSEVGFFYFTGSFFYLLYSPSTNNVLGWLSIAALPYIVYSIGYQYRVKKWCILCCTVQAVLLLEAIVSISYPSFVAIALSYRDSVMLICCFLAPILIWAFLKPFFIDAGQLKPLKEQFKKFKYNADLFNQALKSQPKYSIGEELVPIVLGNPEAETIITMVSNPLCGPCAKAHETINAWLKKNNDIQVKLIFATSDEQNEQRTKVVRHLAALNASSSNQSVENALIDWYNSTDKNYGSWTSRHPISTEEDFSKVTQVQKQWCELAEITFTPTFLVNGYKLPEPYRLEDIKYLIN